jgi:hypothetical protein
MSAHGHAEHWVLSTPVGVFKKKLQSYQISDLHISVLFIIITLAFTLFVSVQLLIDSLLLVVYSAPLWLAIKLPSIGWYYWHHYIVHQFLELPNQEPILLEIKIPKIISKSPRAMEEVFNMFHISPGTTTKFQTLWKGQIIPWFSFEIESREGEIHFYLWAWKRLLPRLESALFSQYPELELVPAVDYSKKFSYSPNLATWGTDYRLKEPDEIPLKTYYDFELEKDPKIEFKVDPFVGILEGMAAVGPGEHMWLQIIFQKASASWKKDVALKIEEIYQQRTKTQKGKEPGEEITGYPILRHGDIDLIKSLERSTHKNAFQVGIRSVYVSTGKFNTIHIQHMVNMFKPMSHDGLNTHNTLTLDGDTHLAGFDYPWEDFMDIRKTAKTKKMLEAYQNRSYFHPPYVGQPMILTTEELATIFHFPGEEATTLGIHRIESKRGGPPSNLPT